MNPLLAGLVPPAANVVTRLGNAYREAGVELFLVGGVVRDLLLGRSVAQGANLDLDFATSAMPEQSIALGEALGATTYLVGQRFGTVGLVFREPDAPSETDFIKVEITTYRTEHYLDSTRHPTVAFGGTLADDLARRDFTVNAIAADPLTGELVDLFDGQADLYLSVLRAVGAPDERFAEDPLRMLRAARFVSQLGFCVETETFAAMVRGAENLARISRERIWDELTKLLLGHYVTHGLNVLRDSGVLAVTLPELAPLADATTDEYGLGVGRGGVAREKDLWEHTGIVVSQAPARPVVRWAALLHDAAKPHCRSVDTQGDVHFIGHEREGAKLADRVLRRLNADKATHAAVTKLVALHARPESYEPDWTDSAVRRLALEAEDVLDDLLDLAAADVTSGREHRRRLAAARVQALRDHVARLEAEHALSELQSPLDGHELMAMFDRPPGRWIAIIKDHLRDMVIEGDLDSTDTTTATEIARQVMANLDEGSARLAPLT